MSCKERFIDGYLFNAYYSRARFELYDFIHEQKRKPVRKNLLNCNRIVYYHWADAIKSAAELGLEKPAADFKS